MSTGIGTDISLATDDSFPARSFCTPRSDFHLVAELTGEQGCRALLSSFYTFYGRSLQQRQILQTVHA